MDEHDDQFLEPTGTEPWRCACCQKPVPDECDGNCKTGLR